MKKPKYITLENYKEFLPSEFVRSFVSDIEVAEKFNKPMNMFTFKSDDVSYLPCLGGMACLNLSPKKNCFRNKTLSSIAFLGNSIRNGMLHSVVSYLKYLYPNHEIYYNTFVNVKNLKQFSGLINKDRFEELKKQVHKYADALEKIGY